MPFRNTLRLNVSVNYFWLLLIILLQIFWYVDQDCYEEFYWKETESIINWQKTSSKDAGKGIWFYKKKCSHIFYKRSVRGQLSSIQINLKQI